MTIGFVVAVCSVCLASTALSATNTYQTSDWSVEVMEALSLYRAGDYQSVQILCDRLVKSRDSQVKRDAAALHAMTLLRCPARSDRLAGASRLAQLVQENPSLAERPECNLALGIARTALAETALALELLETAVEGFAARQQFDRQAEALAALAEAWMRHTEWEVTPPRFNVSRPQTAEQMPRIRRIQVGQVRDRLAKVPNNEDALARVDLLLARSFIEAGDRVADGYRVLEQLAASAQVTPAVAEATLILAAYFEEERHWLEALALYRRLKSEALPPPARQAKQRIGEITRPRLMVDVPAQVPTGRLVRVNLQVRNVDTVQIEVRKVELSSWLESRQGRLIEALLPGAGSIQMAREIDTQATQQHDWWRSETLEKQLEFHAPPGAYVVITRSINQGPRQETTKRLVIVSDLKAVMFVGPQRALIWTPSHMGQNDVQARFWIFGSYVPTKPQFEAGIASFPLPPESRLMLDKHWVCLVKAGEHLALCRGRLGKADQEQSAVTVALVGGPSEPSVGDTLTLTGLIQSEPGHNLPGSSWQLELRDAQDELVSAHLLKPSPAGIFGISVPITDELGGKHLRVILRRDKQVVENIRGRFGVHVAPRGAHDLVVVCQAPPLLDPDSDPIPFQVQAWYPWGIPLSDVLVSCIARAVYLPAPESEDRPVCAGPLPFHDRLDENGRMTVEIPPKYFGLPDGPLAHGLWLNVIGWEGLQATGFGETLQADSPVHAWLRHIPADPQAGQEVRFELNWFDPTRQTGIEPPQLEIRREDGALTRLKWHMDVDGLKSDSWRPAVAGEYVAVANLPSGETKPLQVKRTITVHPADVIQPQVNAHFTTPGNQPGVQVRLAGRLAQPLVIIVEVGDPLAACTLESLDDVAEVFLPLESALMEAHVVLAYNNHTGMCVLNRVEIKPDPAQVLTLQLETPLTSPLPGTDVPIHIACTSGGQSAAEVTLLARLTPADSGYISWVPGTTRQLTWPSSDGLTLAASDDSSGTISDSGQCLDDYATSLVEALFVGQTLWTTALPAIGGQVELAVPLPDMPGLYRLTVLARTPTGALATNNLILNTRSGLYINVAAAGRPTLGDRTLVGIMLENSRPEAVDVHVRIDPGQGLHVESLHVDGAALAVGAKTLDEPISLIVPAAGRIWLQARVEAVRVGQATFRVEAKLADGHQPAEAKYKVLPADQPEARGPALKLKRMVFLLVEDQDEIEPLTRDVLMPNDPPMARQIALRPGDRVLPGQHLLIREIVTLSQPLEALTWSQRIPPNCHAMLSESQADNTIGELRDRGLHLLRYSVPEIAPGLHLHEYELVAVRPGVCLLPPPTLQAAGQPIPTDIEPIEILINVIGSP